MKLCVIGHQYRLAKHWKLGVELKKLGVEVLIVTPSYWGTKTIVTATDYDNHRSKNIADLVYVFHVENEGDILNYTIREAWESIQKFQPDVIFSDSEPCATQSLLSLRWARKLGCKMACYSWENVFKDYGSRSRVERKVLDGCDIAFVGNEGARQNLTKKGCDEQKLVKVLETGIDCEMYKPMPEVEKKYDLLFVGRRVPEKGVEILDQALHKFPQVRMLWVGKGPYQPKHGEVKGYVPEEELPAIYNTAEVFVYPTIGIPDAYAEQGFYSGLEALSCGLPVVSTTNGAIPEILEGCGAKYPLIPPGSLPDLIRAIDYMLVYIASEEHSGWMRDEAHNFIVEKYSLPVIAEKYEQAFRKVMEK